MENTLKISNLSNEFENLMFLSMSYDFVTYLFLICFFYIFGLKESVNRHKKRADYSCYNTDSGNEHMCLQEISVICSKIAKV